MDESRMYTVPSGLFRLTAAGLLLLAISGASQGRAEEITSGKPFDPSEAELLSSADETLFSRSFLTLYGDQVRFNLRLSEGDYSYLPGVEEVTDHQDGFVTVSLSPSFGRARIENVEADGLQGRVFLSSTQVFSTEIDQELSDNSRLAGNDAYLDYRKILVSLSYMGKRLLRDELRSADHVLVIRRSSGALEIQFYQKQDAALAFQGGIAVDKKGYQLYGDIANPAMQETRQNIYSQIVKLNTGIELLDLQIRNADLHGQSTKTLELEREQKQEERKTLFEQVAPPAHIQIFGVSERVNYGQNQWLKIAEDGGEHLAMQGVGYMLSDMNLRAALNSAELEGTLSAHRAKAMNNVITMDYPVDTDGAEQPWLARVSKSVMDIDRELGENNEPAVYAAENLIKRNNTVYKTVDGISLEDTLETLERLKGGKGVEFDKIQIPDDHYRAIRQSMSDNSWGSWLLKKLSWRKQPAENLRQDQRIQRFVKNTSSSVLDLIEPVGVETGLPVLIGNADGEARLVIKSEAELRATLPEDDLNRVKTAYYDEGKACKLVQHNGKLNVGADKTTYPIDKNAFSEQRNSFARRQVAEKTRAVYREKQASQGKWNALWNVGSAYVTGMTTGSALQFSYDVARKYYQEGVLPFNYSKEEWADVTSRSTRTGMTAGVSSAAGSLISPWIAGSYDFLSGKTLKGAVASGLKDHYTSMGVGAAIAVGSEVVSSGYQYWNGERSAREVVNNVARSAVRAVPVALGAGLGHSLVPQISSVPVLSGFGPTRYVGGIAASMMPLKYLGGLAGGLAFGIAYDTALYYGQQGLQAAGKYLAPALPSDQAGDSAPVPEVYMDITTAQ